MASVCELNQLRRCLTAAAERSTRKKMIHPSSLVDHLHDRRLERVSAEVRRALYRVHALKRTRRTKRHVPQMPKAARQADESVAVGNIPTIIRTSLALSHKRLAIRLCCRAHLVIKTNAGHVLRVKFPQVHHVLVQLWLEIMLCAHDESHKELLIASHGKCALSELA